VTFAVMAFVDVKDVAVAFRKVKATSLALAVNFAITPAFARALGWLILRHYPDLGGRGHPLHPHSVHRLVRDLHRPGRRRHGLGVSLLPWNLVLQIALLPAYLLTLRDRLTWPGPPPGPQPPAPARTAQIKEPQP
jgi:ACR3 family arsenite transporter